MDYQTNQTVNISVKLLLKYPIEILIQLCIDNGINYIYNNKVLSKHSLIKKLYKRFYGDFNDVKKSFLMDLLFKKKITLLPSNIPKYEVIDIIKQTYTQNNGYDFCFKALYCEKYRYIFNNFYLLYAFDKKINEDFGISNQTLMY